MVNILTWGAGIFERPKEKKRKEKKGMTFVL